MLGALHLPLFTTAFGRQRGYMIFAMLVLIGAILVLAFADPPPAWRPML